MRQLVAEQYALQGFKRSTALALILPRRLLR